MTITDAPAEQADGDWAAEVRRLATERDAVILAHNYQSPEIQDVADHVGDSLALARLAAASTARTIVLAGVWFMAETAKILCPERTVLIPSRDAGCSLADSITAAQLREWKAQHPSAVVVAYVNTSAEVKAESDVCCTSANAVEIVSAIPAERPAVHPSRVRLRHPRVVAGRRRRAAQGPDLVDRRDADRRPFRVVRLGPGGHRDRHAAPAAEGQRGSELGAGERACGVPVHEDDHAGDAAALPARRDPRSVRGAGRRESGAAGRRSDAHGGRVMLRALPPTQPRWSRDADVVVVGTGAAGMAAALAAATPTTAARGRRVLPVRPGRHGGGARPG